MESIKNRELSWITLFQIISHLQFRGLSILDSACLLEDCVDELTFETDLNGDVGIYINLFKIWISNNEKKLFDYRGAGDPMKNRDLMEIIEGANKSV